MDTKPPHDLGLESVGGLAIHIIISKLGPSEAASVACVNKRFKDWASDGSIWSSFCNQELHLNSPVDPLGNPCPNFKFELEGIVNHYYGVMAKTMNDGVICENIGITIDTMMIHEPKQSNGGIVISYLTKPLNHGVVGDYIRFPESVLDRPTEELLGLMSLILSDETLQEGIINRHVRLNTLFEATSQDCETYF